MDGLFKIFNDIQTEEWTDYEILKDFTENEQTRFCYDWDGLDYERILPAITNILKENEQLKKQKDDVIEYITSYEAISTIQGLDDIEKNKKLDKSTMNEMVNRYLEVHHKILRMLGEIE